MHKALSSDGSRRIIVLHGLGGIGKTQLSVEYAKRHKDSYSAVFWLNIKDTASAKQGFAAMGKRILRDHPSDKLLRTLDMQGSLDDAVDGVKAWLSQPLNTRWLIVYDNYDNPKAPENPSETAVDLREFLPESYQGSVIVTTRSSQIDIGHCMRVQKLVDMRDSLQILSNTSRRPTLMNGKTDFSWKRMSDIFGRSRG